MSTSNATVSPMALESKVEEALVNTIRMLAADAVQEAESGHAGMPMGMAQAAVTLWTQYMRYNPSNAHWFDRDRFVLSAGHGSILLYALLHLTGYPMTMADLKQFRQWGSKTPGHPEYNHAPGIETTTGPLGQGFANGIGMALAECWLAAHFNRPDHTVIDHYTYGIVSDGDLMEGIASEAASLAGHLQLGKVIYLYDNNHVTIDGYTDIAYTEDWAKRFDAYGWHVQSIDGMDGAAVAAALAAAKADPRPSIIGCKTVIGYGSPKLEGTPKAHSDAFGEEELAKTRAFLGFPAGSRFYVPDAVQALRHQFLARGAALEEASRTTLAAYAASYPDEAAELKRFMAGELSGNWQEVLPQFQPGEAMATRNAGGTIINALAGVLPNLIGGSADLAASNKNTIKDGGSFAPDNYAGRNINFGVREHGMAGILNGMAYHGGVIPFGATFFVFSDYMRGSMRLAALSGLPVIYILTHDSVGVGEDGPTHQPVEHLASLRAMPNMTVIRPADANETTQAWRMALQNRTGPTVLVLTRQNLPTLDRAGEGLAAAEEACKGGYTLYDGGGKPQIVLVATGSEVSTAYDAAKALADDGIAASVVSIPSWEIFAQQSVAYRNSVLPPALPKVAIEAAVSLGWERWVGNDPAKSTIISVDRFGASAPYKRIFEELGLTAENVVAKAKALLQ
ncbi:MAG TPA: transketolase [Caldilineaceae bacterium]|nr:transketolase [Caldilineaceae bacterium]